MPQLGAAIRKHALKALGVVAVTAVGLTALGVLPLGNHEANALRVTMKRVVFEGPVRTEVLTIINNTADEQAYRLGWKRMMMTEDKSLETMDDNTPVPGFEEMKEMIRYAPRRIVLPPGASQQIRLMLRRPRDLPDGEYRSHFWIQPEAESVKFDTPENPNPTGASVQIKMLTGLTLPVFVRQGDLTAAATITDARITKNESGNILQYTINREGTRSLYGDVEVLCMNAAGETTVLQQIRGIAVYLEVPRRRLATRLNDLPAGGCSSMSIRYRADEEDMFFKGQTIAEASLQP